MTPRNEMDALLNDAIDMASRLIQKHGTHIPFAMAIDAQGKRVTIAVDDTTMPPVDQMIGDLLSTVRQGCADNSYRAIVFAKNVEYKTAVDGRDVDAIQMTIDHIAADAVTCYLPYTLGRGNSFQPEEVVATDPQYTFFE